MFRSDSPDQLIASGRAALETHGIRTIVDLRNDDERDRDARRPADVTTVHVPLDDLADTESWAGRWNSVVAGSPLYYRPFLERKPERCAAAVAAVAGAEPGGVLVHCVGGRDRTGLVSLLLLALVGVASEEIAADYELSNVRLRTYWETHGEPDHGRIVAEELARRDTSARALILELLTALDAEATLRAGGLGEDELAAVRARLLELPGGDHVP